MVTGDIEGRPKRRRRPRGRQEEGEEKPRKGKTNPPCGALTLSEVDPTNRGGDGSSWRGRLGSGGFVVAWASGERLGIVALVPTPGHWRKRRKRSEEEEEEKGKLKGK